MKVGVGVMTLIEHQKPQADNDAVHEEEVLTAKTNGAAPEPRS